MKRQVLAFIFFGLFALPCASFAENPSVVETFPGSEIDVNQSLADLAKQTETVFKKIGFQVTSNKIDGSGTRQVIKGRRGENTVEVQLTQKSQTQTHVGVIAKRGLVAFNQDLAQQVLEQLIRAE